MDSLKKIFMNRDKELQKQGAELCCAGEPSERGRETLLRWGHSRLRGRRFGMSLRDDQSHRERRRIRLHKRRRYSSSERMASALLSDERHRGPSSGSGASH
eukprot:TRINITY_DN3504_c0_g1_i4.p2 TRINITY_DN3504_c0_g1~~TRINITY_DN3504_c0_g1_i4.p2  ORF type:complete len:101 (+),score=12.40 TRINITY_DN3504_c0_g1_i4:775-1077(+)